MVDSCPKCNSADIDAFDPPDGDDPWIPWACIECRHEWEVLT